MARLFESHVGDRSLFSRLADVKQHIVTLRELRTKLDSARGDYLQTTWDGGSLRVRQVYIGWERIAGRITTILVLTVTVTLNPNDHPDNNIIVRKIPPKLL